MPRTSFFAAILGLILLSVGISTAQTSTPADQSTQPAAQGRLFKVGNGVSAPRVIYNPQPEYTDEARDAQVEGTVVLWAVIRPDGTVADIKVARSLDKDLDKKAVEAVKKWRFEPARKDGQPVAVQVNIEVNFRLFDRHSAPVSDGSSFGSLIETSKDGTRTLSNTQMSLRVVLPAEWIQLSFTPATYSKPAIMLLARKETFATVEIIRQAVEASPSLYRKAFVGGIENTAQSFSIDGEESIAKPDWNGVRLFASVTRHDIKRRCICDIYSREKQHYVIDACAPDELFPKYVEEFKSILKSIDFTDLTPKGK